MKGFVIFLVSICCLFSLGKGYESVCYGDLGCFTDAPPWGNTDPRPVGYVPLPPEDINTRFYLDTRDEVGVEVYNNQISDLARTTFDATKPTKFIIHGYIQYGDTSWMLDMSDALLHVGDFNVFRTGWVGGSLTINYAQSATDIQVVGAEVGLFINNIVSYFGITTKSFHCIGHSLGAQACSYLGASVDPKIARISGLDPAGPYFEGTPIEVRLDSTDADFVDVMHTDAEKLKDLGMGINQISGDVDFWPNNGIEQPGCDQNALSTIIGVDGVVSGTKDFVACNHLRALSLYTESILTSCPFSGNVCGGYDDYLNGKCLECPSGKCSSMGYNSINNKNAILAATNPSNYLQTSAKKPYCEYMTYVEVTLGSDVDSNDGKLFLTLYGTSENTEQEQLSDEDVTLQLRPQTTYSYVAQYSTIPDGFNKVKLLWTKEDWTVTSQHITVDHINVWVDHEQKQYTFCGDINADLDDEVRYSYYIC